MSTQGDNYITPPLYNAMGNKGAVIESICLRLRLCANTQTEQKKALDWVTMQILNGNEPGQGW